MKVKEIMTPDPAFVSLETSLHDVAQMMMDYDCGCVPVVEHPDSRKPIGVLTDRDLTIRTIAHNKDPLNMTAGEVMTDSVINVTPETSVAECLATMERNQIRRLVVVDENGDICGMLAQADIARSASPRDTAELLKDVSMQAMA